MHISLSTALLTTGALLASSVNAFPHQPHNHQQYHNDKGPAKRDDSNPSSELAKSESTGAISTSLTLPSYSTTAVSSSETLQAQSVSSITSISSSSYSSTLASSSALATTVKSSSIRTSSSSTSSIAVHESAAAPAGVRIATAATPIRGVNIGNWLILEKWMNGTVFSGTSCLSDATDQWSFDKCAGAPQALTAHWDTYFTEADVAKLHGWGLTA